MSVMPVLQIQCQPDHIRQNLIFSHEDRRLLERLAERDIAVSLVCGEADAYHVRVQILIRHSRYYPALKAWKMPIELAGIVRRFSVT